MDRTLLPGFGLPAGVGGPLPLHTPVHTTPTYPTLSPGQPCTPPPTYPTGSGSQERSRNDVIQSTVRVRGTRVGVVRRVAPALPRAPQAIFLRLRDRL